MKKFIILYLLTTRLSSAADYLGSPSACGDYRVAGVVRVINDELFVVVNEKSKSEHKIKFPVLEWPTLTPYDNQPVTIYVQLLEKWNGTIGKASAIKDRPAMRIPNPMNPKDTGFELLSSQKCLK